MIGRAKLVRILGMLGSSNDAEVLAAARAAHRIVTTSGSNWAELLVDDKNIIAAEPATNGLNGAWRDCQSRDATLFAWIMSNFELNPVARRLWSSMGEGLYVSDGAMRIGRAAMFLNRGR